MHGFFLNGFVWIQLIGFRSILCGDQFDERSLFTISVLKTSLCDAVRPFGSRTRPDNTIHLDTTIHRAFRIREETSFRALFRQTDTDIPVGGIFASVLVNGAQLNLQIVLDNTDDAEQSDEFRPQSRIFHHLTGLEFIITGLTTISIFLYIKETVIIIILTSVKRVLRIQEAIFTFDEIRNSVAIFVFIFAVADRNRRLFRATERAFIFGNQNNSATFVFDTADIIIWNNHGPLLADRLVIDDAVVGTLVNRATSLLILCRTNKGEETTRVANRIWCLGENFRRQTGHEFTLVDGTLRLADVRLQLALSLVIPLRDQQQTENQEQEARPQDHFFVVSRDKIHGGHLNCFLPWG